LPAHAFEPEIAVGASLYLFDALGSPVTLMAADGSVRERIKLDAWGVVRERTGASENPFAFTGHELDDETGLYYARARFYDPELGRFLSEDPLAGEAETPPSLHRYLYAFDEPTLYVDPSGAGSVEVGGRKIWVPDFLINLAADKIQFHAGRAVAVNRALEQRVGGMVSLARDPEGTLAKAAGNAARDLADISIGTPLRLALAARRGGVQGLLEERNRIAVELLERVPVAREAVAGARAGIAQAEGHQFQAGLHRGEAEIHAVDDTMLLAGVGVTASEMMAARVPAMAGEAAGSVPRVGRVVGPESTLSVTGEAKSVVTVEGGGVATEKAVGGATRGAPPVTSTGPGSAAHKAARWEEYQARGGQWGYDRWSQVYEQNMVRARVANQAADAYHQKLGWGEREVTVDVEGVPRKLDIADVARRRGAEHKTGYQTATQENLWEIERDRILTEQGWEMRWQFDGTASKPLKKALDEAKIPHNLQK
jgi:RHS repeat-associated protein